jgi:hypothetical protein
MVDVLPYNEDDTVECIAASWWTWAESRGGSIEEDGCPLKITMIFFNCFFLQETKDNEKGLEEMKG